MPPYVAPALPDLPEWANPWSGLGSAAGKIVADGWTAAMLGIWNAGLWLLKLVLNIVDTFTTPDLREDGPGQALYQTTFWIAVTLMVILTLAQLGIAAFRRDGESVGKVVIGTGQFLIIWVSWISYSVAVVAACGGLTKAILQSLLHIDGWAQFSPLGTQLSTEDITEGTVATVLGFMGVLMVFAAIGHLIIMLARAAALMVLAGTTPIAAAGLASDFGGSWFWKSCRWFHAAAFTPVLMALVLGIGVELTSGVATGMTEDIDKAVGTAVPGVVLICVGAFAPLALFKLLAFVDPGTNSGAALRAGMSAAGGISGLLSGKSGDSTSSAASSTDQHGKSQGESSGEADATQRASQGIGKLGGMAGQAASAGLDAMSSLGSKGATIGSDVTNQAGIGHNQYTPDFSGSKRSKGKNGGGGDKSNAAEGGPDGGDGQGGTEGTPPTPQPPTPGGGQGSPEGMPDMPTPGGGGQGGSGAGAAGAGGSGGSGAGAAGAGATPPPVV
ncbi:MAG: type IV secretion system protein [Nocardioidaceae bacterium]|nr:type IV secretion system protein [Nocardioidaceae bacterium]